MVKRVMKNYLRDRTGVLMSLLTVGIILVLYTVFLGDNLVNSIEAQIGSNREVANFVKAWVLAGIVTIAPITLSLGVFNSKIEDDLRGTTRALAVAPVSRVKVVSGYLLAGLIVSGFITILTLSIGFFYLKVLGLTIFTFKEIPYLIGLIFINTCCSVTMMFFCTSLIKSRSSFSSFTTIIGTVVGFLAGIYLPIGTLPSFIQGVMKFFPFTYSAALLRAAILDQSFNETFKQIPAEVGVELKELLGITVLVRGNAISTVAMLWILAGSAILFLGLAILRMKRVSNDFI